MYTHTYTYTYTHLHTHTPTSAPVHTPTYLYTDTHTYTYTHVSTHLFTPTQLHTYPHTYHEDKGNFIYFLNNIYNFPCRFQIILFVSRLPCRTHSQFVLAFEYSGMK